MLQELGDFIQAVGFPVAVAAFVLFRMNGKFDKLRESIDKLIRSLDRHTESREKED